MTAINHNNLILCVQAENDVTEITIQFQSLQEEINAQGGLSLAAVYYYYFNYQMLVAHWIPLVFHDLNFKYNLTERAEAQV